MANTKNLNSVLESYVKNIAKSAVSIGNERKESLKSLGDYMAKQLIEGKGANVIFVCTHNSRRSHFGQVWLQVAAEYYEIVPIVSYSAGTEVTAFHSNAIASLKRAGFIIEKPAGDNENPHYRLKLKEDGEEIEMFSKKYDHENNPRENFAAVMVCADADEACPYIPGTDIRISCPYKDPKAYDNTPQEANQYDETCKLIATEMFWVMSYVRNKTN